MNVTSLAAYFLACMLSWYPLKSHDFTGKTQAQTLERYQSIATDLATTTLDPNEEPLLTDSGHYEGYGRAQTGELMLSWAGFESGGFAEDVDTMKKLGDGGHAKCLMQVHSPYKERVFNRISCFHEGLRAMHDSWNMCKVGSIADRLTGYTVGSCTPGESGAELRTRRAMKYWAKSPFVAVIE